MKKGTWILWFIMPLLLCGQEPTANWHIWKDSTRTLTERMEALTALWSHYIRFSPDSAEIIADLQLTLAQESGLPNWRADALKYKGTAVRFQSDFEAAKTLYERSLILSREVGYTQGLASANYNLGQLEHLQGNYRKSIDYIRVSLNLFEQVENSSGMAAANNELGNIHSDLGDYGIAEGYLKEALEINLKIGNKSGVANAYGNLGNILRNKGAYFEAVQHFERAMQTSDTLGNFRNKASALCNIGLVHSDLGNFDRALNYLREYQQLCEEINYQGGFLIAKNNIGMVLHEKKDHKQAENYFKQALELAEEIGDLEIIVESTHGLGEISLVQGKLDRADTLFRRSLAIALDMEYQEMVIRNYNSIGNHKLQSGQTTEALEFCRQAYQLAHHSGLLEAVKNACECLYKVHRSHGDPSLALKYHELLITLADSLQVEETQRQLQQQEFSRKLEADSLKQIEERLRLEMAMEIELDRERNQRNWLLFVALAILMLTVGLWSRLRYIRKSRAQIQAEKDRSESLLLNILPSNIAEELKAKGESAARDFDKVSILFTDFKSFSHISEQLSAQDLVAELNMCFKAFDQIITKYQIEKIKTIGDAYMAAGGLVGTHTSTVKDVVLAAIEMQAFVKQRAKALEKLQKPYFEMRVGISTGPVVAGIVGVKKFQYDVWGDTVNVASRMESQCEVGRVNVSHDTYLPLKEDPDFHFIPRGKIQAKNKKLEMYYVEYIGQEASAEMT